MSQADVKRAIDNTRQFYVLFEEMSAIFAEWNRLVETYGSEGKQNHDARIVAMNIHGITAILTFNTDDFVRYLGLTVYKPKDLVP